MDNNKKLNSETMQDEIRSNLNNPEKMEKLYRENKVAFKQEFSQVYPELKGSPIAGFWQERLNYDSDTISWGKQRAVILKAFGLKDGKK